GNTPNGAGVSALNNAGLGGRWPRSALNERRGRRLDGGPATCAEETDGTTMLEKSMACRGLLAAAMMVAAVPMLATAARAQQVVVIVNGEPITALDIEQRSK